MQHMLPEGTDRSTRNAAGTFSGHRQRSRSEDLRSANCEVLFAESLPGLFDDKRPARRVGRCTLGFLPLCVP